jgi:hypothetical protein
MSLVIKHQIKFPVHQHVFFAIFYSSHQLYYKYYHSMRVRSFTLLFLLSRKLSQSRNEKHCTNFTFAFHHRDYFTLDLSVVPSTYPRTLPYYTAMRLHTVRFRVCRFSRKEWCYPCLTHPISSETTYPNQW